MSEHTKEQWANPVHRWAAGMGECFVVLDIYKELIFIAEEADAHRIVACVNACEGIPIEVLKSPGYSVKAELDSVDEQIRLRMEAENNLAACREKVAEIRRALREYIDK